MIMRTVMTGMLLLATPMLRAGEVIDAIAATVNNHVILQSDWDDEVRYECLMSGRPVESLSAGDRGAALDRMIEQELLREQMNVADFKLADSAEIDKQLESVKQAYPADHNGESWSAALARYQLSDDEVRTHVALEFNQLRLVDARLRPSIQIDSVAVENYYRQQILPKMGSGSEQITLAQASPKIREILLQQRMNELLASWLDTLRGQAQIRRFNAGSAAAPGQGQ
jgi:hypothetical protein